MIDRLVVINDDATDSGGAAAIALQGARMVASRGIKVTLLHGSSTPSPEIPGVEIISIGTQSILEGPTASAAIRGLYNPLARRFINDWITANDTTDTVYHLHNWHKILSPSVFRPLRRVSSRLALTAHDYFLACPNGGQFDYQRDEPCNRRPLSFGCLSTNCDRRHYAHKLWRVARQIMRVAIINLSRTDATVIAVHEGMIPYLQRGGIPERSIRVVRNPVIPWTSARIEAETNQEILFVGRLERDKGIDVIAAAARAAGMQLRIIGDGPLAETLARLHPEAIQLGWRKTAEIGALASHARLAVVPTRWRETFGLVTLEAVMSGLPVLVSRHALIAKEIVELGCGETCDPGDVDSLTAQLRRLNGDGDAVKRMSDTAYRYARTLAPTATVWCDQLLDLYESILVRSHTGRAKMIPLQRETALIH
jgi:glycosyltransferase involved in cell wall biosynthesis